MKDFMKVGKASNFWTVVLNADTRSKPGRTAPLKPCRRPDCPLQFHNLNMSTWRLPTLQQAFSRVSLTAALGSLTAALVSLTALLLSMLLGAGVASAQSDVMGASGKFAAVMGAKGAVANRNVADQLYKQSLADESNAWKSFPPSVSLLTKSLSESKDAKTADDQAKEFARAALYAGQSAGQAGDYQAQRYGGLSDNQLSDLANKSSPYMSQVESKLGGYGMKLDSDKMALQTPFGKFNVNMPSSELEKTLVGVANSFGFSGDGVTKGIQDANKTRDAIAAAAEAAVAKDLAAAAGNVGGADRGVASAKASAAAAKATPAAAAPAAGASTAVTEPNPNAVINSTGTSDADWDARQRALLANQDEARRRLGLKSLEASGPLGRPEENLFQKVHDRYMALDAIGSFL